MIDNHKHQLDAELAMVQNGGSHYGSIPDIPPVTGGDYQGAENEVFVSMGTMLLTSH